MTIFLAVILVGRSEAITWRVVVAAVAVFAGATIIALSFGRSGVPWACRRAWSVGMDRASFVIDIVAIPLCVAGALLALFLVWWWGRLFPHRLLLVCTGGVCALDPALRSHLPRGIMIVAGLRNCDLSLLERWSLFVYEPWCFTGGVLYRRGALPEGCFTGGVLYGAAAWVYGRRPSRLGPCL